MSTAGPRLAAGFDAVAWSQDVTARYRADATAYAVAERARREFEQHGVPRTVQPCEPHGRGGRGFPAARRCTCRSPGRPASERPFGMVFALVIRDDVPVLEFIAFGVRHQPTGSRAPSVYEIAHHRLHGDWPRA